VTNRTFHILCELQLEFDVTLVAFSRRNHQPTGDALAAARAALANALSDVREPSLIASEWSSTRKAWNHLRSLATRRPYVYYEYAGAAFAGELGDAIRATPPALVHLDSLDLYRWIRPLPHVPLACTHHSIESDLLRLRAARVRSRPLRWYLRHQADLLEHEERALCATIDLNVMMSEIDAARLRALAPAARTTVVPNGVNTDYFRPAPAESVVPGRLVFLGPTYMLPNRDAMDFFLDDIWPLVKRRIPDSSLHLVGRNPPADRARFSRHAGVTCQGYVPDIRPHMAGAQCSIVPLRIGGGTRLKILDAWAMGKAVVSTSIGCEGLEVKDGENILIRDDPPGFAEAIAEVLGDDALRGRLERNARLTAEKTYSWSIVGQHLRASYASLLQAARPQRASGVAR
jgi:glycosyltransferase involved in cell wall biosynthesis